MVEIVRDIRIIYGNEHASKIEDVKNIIDNNYFLFLCFMDSSRTLSFIPTNDDNSVYVPDFEKTFFKIVDQVFNKENFMQMVQDKEVLLSFYLEHFIRECGDNSKSLFQPNPVISDEVLYDFIAFKYFCENGTFNDFVEYLKSKKDTDMIVLWLQNEIRYDVYNYILGTAVNYLKSNDFEFLENMSNVIVKTLDQLFSDILSNEKSKNEELTTISVHKLDTLFYDFLDYINAPVSWKQLYNQLKRDNKISFKKCTNNKEISTCYYDENGVLRISISFNERIDSFCAFVHEFIHYLHMINSTLSPQFSLLEFPSIFFEKVAAHFLKNKGYSENVVNSIIEQRKQNNMEIFSELSSLFNDIATFINCGPITRTDKIDFWKNRFRIIQEAKESVFKLFQESGAEITEEDLELLKPIEIDYESNVDIECDALIIDFIQNGLLILDGYQYLLDTFLADEVIKRATIDPTVINKMINIANNLGKYNLFDILTEFNMQDLFYDNKLSKHVKTLKL